MSDLDDEELKATKSLYQGDIDNFRGDSYTPIY